MVVPVTSGIFVSNPAAAKIISGALRLVGAIAEGETPQSDMALDTLDAFNGMVKAWQASGIHLWAEQDATLFLQPGQSAYQVGQNAADHAAVTTAVAQTTLANTGTAGASSVTVASAAGIVAGDNLGIVLDSGRVFWSTVNGAPTGLSVPLAAVLPSQASPGALTFDYGPSGALVRPLRVMAGRRLYWPSNIETPMIPLSRIDYANMPNKQNTGTITQFFYDPSMNYGYGVSLAKSFGQMHVWPAPSDAQSAMRFTMQRPLMDFVSMANVPDFPQEWTSALRFGLAVEIALEFDVPADRMGALKAMATEKFAMASAWDREPEPVLFGYATEPGYRT